MSHAACSPKVSLGKDHGICRYCGAEIYWLRKAEGNKADGYRPAADAKPNPIDVKPAEKGGNLVIDRVHGLYRTATGSEREMAVYKGQNLYVSHFATCTGRERQ